MALFALRLLQQAVEEELPKELCRAGLSYLPQTLHQSHRSLLPKYKGWEGSATGFRDQLVVNEELILMLAGSGVPRAVTL